MLSESQLRPYALDIGCGANASRPSCLTFPSPWTPSQTLFRSSAGRSCKFTRFISSVEHLQPVHQYKHLPIQSLLVDHLLCVVQALQHLLQKNRTATDRPPMEASRAVAVE